jgi:hypothetical protein
MSLIAQVKSSVGWQQHDTITDCVTHPVLFNERNREGKSRKYICTWVEFEGVEVEDQFCSRNGFSERKGWKAAVLWRQSTLEGSARQN